MSNLNVLVVWTTTEETSIYLVNISRKELDFLKEADGRYINLGQECLALECLHYSLCKEVGEDGGIPEYISKDMEAFKVDPSWYGRFKDCKLQSNPDLSQIKIESIIVSGFID